MSYYCLSASIKCLRTHKDRPTKKLKEYLEEKIKKAKEKNNNTNRQTDRHAVATTDRETVHTEN